MNRNLTLITLAIVGLLSAKEPRFRDMTTVGPRTEAVELQAYQHLYYVSIEKGSDKSGDGSRERPWRTLTAAMTKISAAGADRRVALLVSQGRYDSTTIVMKEWVDLFGGFCPHTWQRDIFKYRTILDGMLVRRVVVGANHARLDGFVVTRGVVASHGGGILCWDTSPIISNNIIQDNRTLASENFDHHHMYQPGHHGGGMACFYNAAPVIRNNIIASNQTAIGCGGGVAFYGWLRIDGIEQPKIEDDFLVGGLQPLLVDNVIVNNISGVDDVYRTRSSSGGAIFCAYEARPLIRNNVIAVNRAMGRSDAGGIYVEYFSYPIIEGNWIVGNVAEDDGGGIYTMRMGQPLIRDNYIAGNYTTGGGVGGVRLSKEGRGRIVGNIIVHNQSGGGVQCVDSYMELENNVIMHNRGGGLSYSQCFNYLPASLVRNNIIRENGPLAIDIRQLIGRGPIFQGNNIEGAYEGEANFDQKLVFIDDVVKGIASSLSFTANSFTTTIMIDKSELKRVQLAGRVLRLANRWSVIQSATDKRIVIWGDLTHATDLKLEYEIISQYKVR